MRVLFAAPRKTGNAYLRCLLASAYALQVVGLHDAPPTAAAGSMAAWLDGMPEDSVAGTGLAWSPELQSMASARDITLLGVIRHPFDLFLSNFEVAQQKAARDKSNPEDAPLIQTLSGYSLDDPAIVRYAADGFSAEMKWLRHWHDAAVPPVRYEQLLSMPDAVLAALSPTLGPLAAHASDRAVDLCQADNLVVSRPARGRRMPAVSPGAWRERLPAQLQSMLRERYADDVAYLGYAID